MRDWQINGYKKRYGMVIVHGLSLSAFLYS